MKSLPALISLATAAVLILIAIAASFIESVPFALIASSVIGVGTTFAFLALFAADYGPPPRVLRVVDPEESKRELDALLRMAAARDRSEPEIAPALADEITVNFLSTVGLDRQPSTLSLL
jgi:hypothetical protein